MNMFRRRNPVWIGGISLVSSCGCYLAKELERAPFFSAREYSGLHFELIQLLSGSLVLNLYDSRTSFESQFIGVIFVNKDTAHNTNYSHGTVED